MHVASNGTSLEFSNCLFDESYYDVAYNLREGIHFQGEKTRS